MFFDMKILSNFLLLGYKFSLDASEIFMLEDNENFLLESARAGDPIAFEIIYTRYRFRMKSLVGQYVHNRQDVDDIVQIIFMRAFKGLRRFRGEATLFTWLFSIAMNSMKNYFRHKMRIELLFVYSIDESEYKKNVLEGFHGDDPEGICSAMETSVELMQILSNLPPVLKTVLLLREDEGMSYGEIARKMGCPLGTVRSRIHRARTEVRKILHKIT